MNEMNPEELYQKLLSQPVTMKLGDILGSSCELRKRFQATTRLQHFAIPQTRATLVEMICGLSNQEEEDDWKLLDPVEFAMNSGQASSLNAYMEELCDMSYQRMLQ